MKKLLLISFALVIAFLSSCRSGDEANDNVEQMLITGTWRPDKIATTTIENGGSTTLTTVMDECQKRSRLLFETETTGKIKYFDNENGTCALLFDLLITYTYDPSTKEFSLTTNGNKMVGAVTSLTSTKMEVFYVDKSNPASTSKVEISATKVDN